MCYQYFYQVDDASSLDKVWKKTKKRNGKVAINGEDDFQS